MSPVSEVSVCGDLIIERSVTHTYICLVLNPTSTAATAGDVTPTSVVSRQSNIAIVFSSSVWRDDKVTWPHLLSTSCVGFLFRTLVVSSSSYRSRRRRQLEHEEGRAGSRSGHLVVGVSSLPRRDEESEG